MPLGPGCGSYLGSADGTRGSGGGRGRASTSRSSSDPRYIGAPREASGIHRTPARPFRALQAAVLKSKRLGRAKAACCRISMELSSNLLGKQTGERQNGTLFAVISELHITGPLTTVRVQPPQSGAACIACPATLPLSLSARPARATYTSNWGCVCGGQDAQGLGRAP